MNIGFDAKRFFHNNTGLGNYSRTLISGLSHYFAEHNYFLFNPKPSNQFQKPAFQNVHEILPSSFFSKKISSAWRSSWVKNDLKRLNIHLYHGLSHEIPIGIERTNIPSVVTIHDLIFEHYPEQFKKIDVRIYSKKFRYACNNANRIIAISQQTKKDIIDLYKIDNSKIDICYQSCNPAFAELISEEEKTVIRGKYNLPQEFFLYVGSVIERKNLLNICKALYQVRDRINIPLLIIGDGKEYKQKVKTYLKETGLVNQVIFLSEQYKNDSSFQSPKTFAAIYQMAMAMIYPSFYEGFGIPVLEALSSKLPVITSNVSCLPETGGDAAYYVNPANVEEIAIAMSRIYEDGSLRAEMKQKGWNHAQSFSLEKCTKSVMDVYSKLLNT